MTITVGITHHTEYNYDKHINMGPHVFRLRPAPHTRTPVNSYSLKIYPENHFINWQQDPFGNYLARVVFPEPTNKFSFTVDVVADLTVINPFDFFLEEYAETFPFTYDKSLQSDLIPYLEKEPACSDLIELIKQVNTDKEIGTVDFLVSVNQVVANLIEYGIRMEPGVQTVAETLSKKSGSCRDSSWLLVQLFRNLGLAARFVSGYLVQLAADEKSLDGPSGPEQDFTDLHAWCEVYIPGAGWIGLDPTSGLFAGEGHIPLACTPEPGSAAPVSGAIDKCDSTFSFSNQVIRINEPPRSTKPYTDEQWTNINDLGQNLDGVLSAEDIKLTMGGEPTFISIDDMESEQWNTAADGADKRKLAHNLFDKLIDTFTTGAFKHYGQGKWYPGEPLPRWQYAAYWRKDGEPLWQTHNLLASPTVQGITDTSQAKTFIETLTHNLGLPKEVITCAYEDILYHMWQEAQLPIEPSPDSPELLHAMSRQGFLAKMERGIEKPVGYILPITFDQVFGGWQSCQWQFKRKYCFLLPGESPIGYRLPLDSIGSPAPLYERDPSDIPTTFSEVPNTKAYVSENTILTALAIEVRDGNLHVFMPPLSYFEHYALLLGMIEKTAKSLNTPVIIEGYTPPQDSRIDKFAVTPDPGVIEVNIHPSSDWSTLLNRTQTLYTLARECRLATQKFMVDGRQTGTGGGNHVTLGAANTTDSPFLRRPDLLRSFITFWQHHPGLSYLFAGTFIGPTSQAPRVDEARDERLYELEIAFSQFPEGEVPEPWLIDRLLRHLLTDLTGNTHRSEFCIDKLYNPDSASGRLGLVEFRGFEMPPHAQMSMVQMLLLRALVVRFWKQPYSGKLVRWGTRLHDKFLLPYFVKQDMQEVCEDLRLHGIDFKFDWLAPFFTFRFPILGSHKVGDLQLQLFSAIEPWHVLGEEATQSGTSRYVDSSLERVQLKVSNLSSDRYVISCNGRRVPLHECETPGEWVAGIRFRAWQPPSALHPTIGVHAPLVFDVYDTWSGRSIGGFTYHVSHPGGRSFEQFPINSYEAEGRRIARFWSHGHTPPRVTESMDISKYMTNQNNRSNFDIPAPEPANPDYPHTLDMRRTIS
ncbi:transglutaminase family protein [Agaribacter flavus]|uniref:DUF2126 domain-containing protein n=1 Tax=Agaribacter flavus TaxID=1902781 RepID=A0ABV7FU23_9ALTE